MAKVYLRNVPHHSFVNCCHDKDMNPCYFYGSAPLKCPRDKTGSLLCGEKDTVYKFVKREE
jgi:hypothetical protein